MSFNTPTISGMIIDNDADNCSGSRYAIAPSNSTEPFLDLHAISSRLEMAKGISFLTPKDVVFFMISFAALSVATLTSLSISPRFFKMIGKISNTNGSKNLPKLFDKLSNTKETLSLFTASFLSSDASVKVLITS